MSSLAHCFEKFGIHPLERAELRKAAKEYRNEGFIAQEANEKAVSDYLKSIEETHSGMVDQIRAELTKRGRFEEVTPTGSLAGQEVPKLPEPAIPAPPGLQAAPEEAKVQAPLPSPTQMREIPTGTSVRVNGKEGKVNEINPDGTISVGFEGGGMADVKPEEITLAGPEVSKEVPPVSGEFLKPVVTDKGEQIEGKAGGTHTDIIEAEGLRPDEPHRGFITPPTKEHPEGQLLTRKEAVPWMEKNQPEVYKRWREVVGPDATELFSEHYRKAAGLEEADLQPSATQAIPPAVPEGWKTAIQPNWRRTPGWKAEVDWKNKRIVFETEADSKNPDIINHEIGHIQLEDKLGDVQKLSDSPLLQTYAKIRKEPKGTHINFIREHLAMDYGQYLTDPEKVKPELKTLFEKYFPKEGVGAVPPTAQHLELMPEEYPNIEKVAVKQDGKIYTDHVHGEIIANEGLDPEKAIPGFLTKQGKFVEQYPEGRKPLEEFLPKPPEMEDIFKKIELFRGTSGKNATTEAYELGKTLTRDQIKEVWKWYEDQPKGALLAEAHPEMSGQEIADLGHTQQVAREVVAGHLGEDKIETAFSKEEIRKKLEEEVAAPSEQDLHAKVNAEEYEKRGPVTAYIVDGEYIRKNIDEEFSNFAQHFDKQYVPENEIWLDKENVPNEYPYTLDNALTQRLEMARGKSFNEALKRGNAIEKRERQRANPPKKSDEKLSPQLVEDAKKELLGTIGKDKIPVWLVAGDMLREVDPDFVEGGNDGAYKWMPEKTIIIDDDISPEERTAIIIHEGTERDRIINQGMKYPKAHELSSQDEHDYREDPTKFEASKKYAEVKLEPARPKEFPKELEPLSKALTNIDEEVKAKPDLEPYAGQAMITSAYNFFNIGAQVPNRLETLKSKLAEYGFAGESAIKELKEAYRAGIKEESKPPGSKGKEEIVGNWEKGESRPFAFDPNSTENEGRFRLLPSTNIKGTSYFRRKSRTNGVSYIVGKDKATGEEVTQAIRFDKSVMPEEKAAKWWEENKGRFEFYGSKPKEEIQSVKGRGEKKRKKGYPIWSEVPSYLPPGMAR